MDWTAKIDQQRNAVLLTFYMFISMTLLVIRTGLDVRGAPANFSFSPYDDPLITDDQLSSTQSDRLDQLYAAALALLFAAEVVARQLVGLERYIYELMQQAYAMAKSLRDLASKPSAQCGQAMKRFDSS